MGVKACNRCHSAKEKCTFAGNDQQCTRCRRLSIPCSMSRRSRRIGRRPSAKVFPHGKVQVWSMEGQESEIETSLLVQYGSNKLPEEKELIISPERLIACPISLQTTSDALRIVKDLDQFTAVHMPFMLGYKFIPQAQNSVSAILSFSGPAVTEGYLAFLSLMTGHQRAPVIRVTQPDMDKAARGLQKLRDLKVEHDYDAACALLLGQTMYVFNVLRAPYSNTAHSIVRSALLSVKRWFSRLIKFPVMDNITMTPLIIDTVECLVHRTLPIIRLPRTNRIIIDRYTGICASLLPLLYDICEYSHARKQMMLGGESEPAIGGDETLNEIEQRIRDWKPPSSLTLFDDLRPNEILAINTQAAVYRLAALLIIHRLRYPLGVEDEIGQGLASEIFAQLSFFAPKAEKSTALPIVFPITMAMLEIEGPGEELLEKFAPFTVQRISAARLQGFIKQVRAARESGFKGIWFELVEPHLQVAIPP